MSDSIPERISYEQLVKDSKAFALTLPKDIDYIVGVPRSGMLVATIIACQLDLPLSMFTDSWLETEMVGSIAFPNIGRNPITPLENREKEFKPKILFVDDYYNSGATIRGIRKYRNNNRLLSDDIYAVLYYEKDCNKHGFDIGFLEVEKPIFEWSL